MANWGDKPRPKSWASGLRPVSRDRSGTTQETPKSANPSEEKEFRFLMGQSFMDGGLDGLMREQQQPGPSNKRSKDSQDEESQEAVDNMLSNILKKTKTELKHVNPTLLDSQPENPSNNQPWQNHYQPLPYYPPANMAYHSPPPLPPFIDVSKPPPFVDPSQAAVPFIDLTKPPPNFAHSPVEPERSASGSSTSATTPTDAPEKKIERKWGNILKTNDSSSSARHLSESNVSTSPSHGSFSPSASESPTWTRDHSASTLSSGSPAKAANERATGEEPSNADPASSSKNGNFSSAPPPQRSTGFKNIMSFDIDPVNMTYCGKEFIDIVDVPSRASSTGDDATSEAICHLCQLNRLMPQDLALHLDGDKHYKNLRNFIMEKEYDTYAAKQNDPLHVALNPDFNTYMLRRYPSRLDEYFEKTTVIDPATMKARSEFQLRFKPTKMLLAEKETSTKKNGAVKLKVRKEQLSECPYCSEMIALDKIATHSCDAMQASEQAPTLTRVGTPAGVPYKGRTGIPTQGRRGRVPPPMEESTPLVLPPDAVDVRLKLEMCKEYDKFGQCQYAKKCMFAHSAAELNTFTYRRTKTELCLSVKCLELCGKAHSNDELVACSKTQLCRSHVELDSCQYKDKCQFAHGVRELLSPFDSRPLAFGKASDSRSAPSGNAADSRDQARESAGESTKAPSAPVAAQSRKMDGQKSTTATTSKIKLTLKKF